MTLDPNQIDWPLTLELTGTLVSVLALWAALLAVRHSKRSVRLQEEQHRILFEGITVTDPELRLLRIIDADGPLITGSYGPASQPVNAWYLSRSQEFIVPARADEGNRWVEDALDSLERRDLLAKTFEPAPQIRVTEQGRIVLRRDTARPVDVQAYVISLVDGRGAVPTTPTRRRGR